MAEEDKLQVIFERLKTGKIDKININVKWFKNDKEYKKNAIHLLISELYRKVYLKEDKNKGKGEGD